MQKQGPIVVNALILILCFTPRLVAAFEADTMTVEGKLVELTNESLKVSYSGIDFFFRADEKTIYETGDGKRSSIEKIAAYLEGSRKTVLPTTVLVRVKSRPRDEGQLTFADKVTLLSVKTEKIDVAKVQSDLKNLGFDPGPADGKPGNQTTQAIRKFQKAVGKTQTGHIDYQLVRDLNDARQGRLTVRQGPAEISVANVHKLAQDGNHEGLVSLLDQGIDVDTRDSAGNKPLIYAVMSGSLTTVNLLLENGSRVNDGGGGSTALHVACGMGHLDVAIRLIESGANVNAQDKVGNTPLMMAIYMDKPSLVKLLVDHSADFSIANNRGQLPVDAADRKGNKEVLQALDR